eukprot:CAMPEP_0203920730 /NCGR_PEP_ID=MMETSP0359-20131031/60994_1 /ASSEMBLY_ACC=CAM_ASM_000338 /TAXON_ID=268821 /ORGANISM="Scrippsiella Hangoei, Strain SHTV-5" /LENGTH=206 /DNA_ID=CAMNT_0050848289 /DNA_START=1 /DNA_END=619 /DNA_ORIENTATION=+
MIFNGAALRTSRRRVRDVGPAGAAAAEAAAAIPDEMGMSSAIFVAGFCSIFVGASSASAPEALPARSEGEAAKLTASLSGAIGGRAVEPRQGVSPFPRRTVAVAPNSPAQWVGEHQQVVKAVAAPAAHKANATAALAKGLEARGAKPSTSKVTLHSYQYKQQVAPSIGGRMESPSATADVIQQFPAETGFLRSSASSAYSGQDVAT